jgi:PadR family transcriptional regulator, regulatory protein PadR
VCFQLVQGWVDEAWGRTKGNRRARYYTLTRSGRRQLERELARYHRVTQAIGRVLQTA